MKKSLIAFFGLVIMMTCSVTGYSNSRDGTTSKIGNVYDISVNEAMPVDIQVPDAIVLDDIAAISATVKHVKAMDYVASTPPGLPANTGYSEVPYGNYLLKNYTVHQRPTKNRYRRDQAFTLTYEKTSSGLLRVPSIRKLLC